MAVIGSVWIKCCNLYRMAMCAGVCVVSPHPVTITPLQKKICRTHNKKRRQWDDLIDYRIMWKHNGSAKEHTTESEREF